jgi:hypothetical protein
MENSVMSGATFVNGSHCCSYSKSIKAVCLATHHSEYYGLTEGAQMAIWIASVLRGLQFRVVFPCPVVADNQSALATACVPETKSSRHIHLREHWIRDIMELGDLVLGILPGPMNAANVGTKTLPAPQFKKESNWYLRGIHDEKYQDQIRPTLRDVFLRSFQWNHVCEQRRRKREDAALVEIETAKTAKRHGAKSQISNGFPVAP